MSTASSFKIVLCHPFEIFRDGIARLFQKKIECQIVGRHANPGDALRTAVQSKADLVFIDLTYFDAEVFCQMLKSARRGGLAARTVLLADAEQLRVLDRSLQDGFADTLLNTRSAEDLLATLGHARRVPHAVPSYRRGPQDVASSRRREHAHRTETAVPS